MNDQHRMHDDSLDAWDEVRERLTEYQQYVFRSIGRLNEQGLFPWDEQVLDYCVANIAACYHWQINNITGVVRKLIDAGVVVEHGKRIHEGTGRHRRTLRLATVDEYRASLTGTQHVAPSEKCRLLRRCLTEVRQAAVEIGLFGGEIVSNIDSTLKRCGYNLPGDQ